MNAHVEMMDLSFGVAAMGLTLLALASWRLRSTSVGRSFVTYVCVADLWVMLRLGRMNGLVESSQTEILVLGLELLMAALVLRLAAQAASATSQVSVGNEVFIWIPPVVILMLGDQGVAALWSTMAFATASVRLTRVPLRSWSGFREALYGTSGAILLPGLIPLAWLGGVPLSWLGVIAPLSICGLGVALFYGLPRLGLLSSDRVHHSSVIEAMSDGVLVVDMNGRLVDFNQAAGEILDLDEGRYSLEHLDDALADHPDLIELFSGAIDGQSIYAPESIRRQGDARTYDLRLSALFDTVGSIRSRILVLRDITDRIEVEEENRRQARHVRMVHQVSAAVYEAETIESGIEKALSLIANTMGFPLGHFLRSAEEAEGSRLVASGIVHCGLNLDAEAPDVSVPLEAEDRVGTKSSGAFSSHAVRDFDPRGVHWWKDLGFEPAFTLPVLIGHRMYGVFEFFSRERMEVDYGATELLEHVGELVGRAVERKLAEEKIRRLAFRDDLTGLPNRQRFHHLLRGAVSLASREERSMALLFMDLDGFKKVNDTLGHEAGDRLLAEVANRFARVVRVSDHVGRQTAEVPESATFRLGGDEFTVLLTEVANPTDAALVAERLLATLERPIVLDGQELFIGTSIGIAVYPEDGEDTESLLRNADAAMYFAKGRGRNGYQFYSEDMNRTRSSRLAIEARLRGALERDDFVLHYQPILDAETGEIIAAEALLRWVDEERGFVPPEEFIAVAEETGLIVPIGKWVFRTACIQAQRWREDFQTTIRIGVNVSGHQIRERSMVDMVREALSETGVAPDQVELELTESTIMQDDALTVSTLRELKQMGVGLSLDDFGTGYSSLSYLRRFTIDRVKIDRSFVSELPGNADDAALTAAIVAMAHGLRLKVVAEGVETAQQALFLRQRGCDELQGYLFGRPCPADEFVDLLRARPRPDELWKDDGSEG